jgi:peptide/nickel transport system substrate-binding protein
MATTIPMTRRTLLGTAAALAAPGIIQAEAARTLRFIPHADLASLDPVWTTADIARNHGNMIYDQLYGLDVGFQPHPQMVAGARIDDDGKTWDLTLREGLTFHDKTPVLARDCAASISRWAKRDAYGSVLLARTEEIAAPSDSVIRIRLKQAVRAVARGAGAAELRHDARACGQDRRERADHRSHRRRAVPLRDG